MPCPSGTAEPATTARTTESRPRRPSASSPNGSSRRSSQRSTARLVLAVVPVDRELDLKRLATAAGGHRAIIAEPAQAERATGYVVGGISPLGARRPLPVVVDVSALDHATVFVSAGRRGLQLELAPVDLVRLCSAISAQIARDHGPG